MSEIPGEPLPPKKERGDLADPKKVGRRDLLDRLQSRQQEEDVLFVLGTVQGRRFYWNLMKKCGIFEEPFTGNNSTFFNCGRGSIGRMLLAQLNDLDPSSYLKMIEESKFEEQKRS